MKTAFRGAYFFRLVMGRFRSNVLGAHFSTIQVFASIYKKAWVNPIYPGGAYGPLGKDCPGTKNWTGPEAQAFGTFIII